jgi:phage replication-related protein YjqB (UPF0714/DUF867 family)
MEKIWRRKVSWRPMLGPATDKYTSFAELANSEAFGEDYRVRAIEREGSPVLIVAPHGGTIEIGTSELAALIAGEEHNLFAFEGLKPRGRNRDLHITSHRFDHPECLALARRCSVAIGLHGCIGESSIYVGGLDNDLALLLTRELTRNGYPATAEGHKYLGRNPLNICNRGTRGRGAQLELTRDFREARRLPHIASVVRAAISEHVDALAQASR